MLYKSLYDQSNHSFDSDIFLNNEILYTGNIITTNKQINKHATVSVSCEWFEYNIICLKPSKSVTQSNHLPKVYEPA